MTASNDIRDTAGVVSDGGAVVSVAGICEHHRKIGQLEGEGEGGSFEIRATEKRLSSWRGSSTLQRLPL